ncbi:la-related protein 6C-like isoform X1 [Henckelia pumila]|uniref:la-related protein 6C-like isoform X1 n=1 Tax=Henckelia pumila TaxID=405737 RepID=UPI003C6E9F96
MAQLVMKKGVDIGDDLQVFADAYEEEAKGEGMIGGGTFKFNAAAPEFVPRLQPAEVSMMGYFFPCLPYIDGNSSGGSWIYVAAGQETCNVPLVSDQKPNVKAAAKMAAGALPQHREKENNAAISEELKKKIIKQVEYQFSDMSLLANESFVKHVNKDPEGFVPMNIISSTKKLKSLNVSHQIMAESLRSSSKLIVSHDGKKVKRKQPFTEKEKEELQLRTVIAENLPDDHSHQNIEKIFNVVGSIKAIRICQPQDPNASRSSKGDLVISNKVKRGGLEIIVDGSLNVIKTLFPLCLSDLLISLQLHALVEYENHRTAEKAAEKLNDERNWREGMRVRVMLRRSPKSVLKNRKSEFEGYLDHDEGSMSHEEDSSSRANVTESFEAEESSAGSKKIWAKNRAKTKPRSQLQTARSLPTTNSSSSCSFLGEISGRQNTKGPRMPDGTRGFTMGRGKPLSIPVHSS